MSPQCLARLSEFRRGQVEVTVDGHRYERWYGCLLRLFRIVQRWDREDEELERRPFVQAEFDAFRADPKRQALVDRIFGELTDDF